MGAEACARPVPLDDGMLVCMAASGFGFWCRRSRKLEKADAGEKCRRRSGRSIYALLLVIVVGFLLLGRVAAHTLVHLMVAMIEMQSFTALTAFVRMNRRPS